MERAKEYAAVCLIGSVGYSTIEILWRGFTHWTMSVAGGIGFLLLYLTDLELREKHILQKCLTGCILLTELEFIMGCIVNRICQMHVWDYSAEKGNVMGQICPLYTVFWFLLSLPVFILSAIIRGCLRPAAIGRKICSYN